MDLDTLALENVSADFLILARLFRGVSNVDFLRQQLLSRNPAFEYAFLDAAAVFSQAVLSAAVYKAQHAFLSNTLLTPNMHSEIVLSLSPSNNIADAYRRWGLTPGKTKDVLVVKILHAPRATTSEADRAALARAVAEHVYENVDGTSVSLAGLDWEQPGLVDLPAVRKYYKLNAVPAFNLERIKSDERAKRGEMEKLILMAMALRGL